ncbi:MAG: Rieske 2Fe-2S domain-containing protein [Chloroflexi bacterium]|nr:Rieske 2Fe-2S domain-containing protein [Chloroflexota bacterium]
MTEQEKTEETPEETAPQGGEATGAAPEGEAKEQPAAPADAPQAKAAKPAKKEKEPAKPGGPSTAVVQPKRVPGTAIVSRRRVLQLGFWSGMGAILAAAGAGFVDFVYPRGVAGFGGTVSVGAAAVPAPGQKVQIPAGRFWLVNLTEEQGGPGLLALWWKCPHLGCTVPWKPNFIWPDPTTGADKKGWFRCPCHGSTYTDAGIRVFGPAPRSLDTMDLTIGSDGRVSVNTGSTTDGAPDNPDRAVRL